MAKPAIVVQRPVVGDAAHDREARAAVGAVDERVAVAAVGRVEQLGQALLAGRRCRARPARRGSPAAALGAIAKPRSPVGASSSSADASTAASGGASAARRARKPLDGAASPSTSSSTPRSSLQHEARQPELARQPVHVRPEADALHRALDRARARRRAASVTRAPPAPAARGTRWPAPPGCAGCARERVTTTWSASPSAAIAAAVVADHGDRAQRRAGAPRRARRCTLSRVAARRQREQHVARAPVRDHLAREDRAPARCRSRAR